MTTLMSPPPTRSAASYSPPTSGTTLGHGLARGLGWFSIGLGLAEFLAPRTMARLTGVPHPQLLQLYGLREIAAGVGIFSNPRPAGWLWARVAGDALDLATIGAAMAEDDSEGRTRAWVAAAAVAGVTALDVLCAAELTTAAES
jgi:hypothetical protein